MLFLRALSTKVGDDDDDDDAVVYVVDDDYDDDDDDDDDDDNDDDDDEYANGCVDVVDATERCYYIMMPMKLGFRLVLSLFPFS